MTDAESRFWEKVDKRGPQECWPWRAAHVRGGRGQFWYQGRNRIAPAMALIFTGSPMPFDGAFACHSCDNPACVNPAHLWWGDARSNGIDAASKGRVNNQQKTHCVNGHPFSGDNVRIKNGWRQCRACERARSSAANKTEKRRKYKLDYYHRKAAALAALTEAAP